MTLEEYPHGGEVSAKDFAICLYDYMERNDMLTLKQRDQFIEIATNIIYEAMLETCGQGIKSIKC